MAAPGSEWVRAVIDSLARSFKRVSVYRHARDQHLTYLEPALVDLRGLLETRGALTVFVEPTAIVYEDQVIHTEPARESGFCYRLHTDGVRSLTFKRGVEGEELLSLAYAAMMDPQVDYGGREDAVTELWKAELAHIEYTAGAGYRMDESGGESIASSIVEVVSRAQDVIDRYAGEKLVDGKAQPPLWSDEQRRIGDPQDYGALARRAALTILRIVDQDHAGWDLDALQEAFWRLIDQMMQREARGPLAAALDRLRRIGGTHAVEFRTSVAKWLSDPARFDAVVKLSDAKLLSAWAQLLPKESGPALLAALPLARDEEARRVLAAAAVARIDSCEAKIAEILRKGAAAEVSMMLAALAPLPPPRSASLAAAAFENAAAEVRLDAIPLVYGDPSVAVKVLGPALSSASRAVRVASVAALARCGGGVEHSANLILAAIAKPQFARVDKEEKTLFYRVLGSLGSNAGHSHLIERLSRRPRKIFGRRKVIDEQLLAVQGLAEEGTQRALRVLEDAALPGRKQPAAVVAACKAAANHIRSGASRGGRTG